MSKKALVEKRPFLVLSVCAALLYYFVQDSAMPDPFLVLIKGSAVGLLAVYAWLRHGSQSARLLAAALVAAAIGDMAIRFDFVAGGAAFFVYHVIALALFLRHKGKPMEGKDSLIFITLLLGTPLLAWYLPADEGMRIPVALYALALGAMAAGAWASDFPRRMVGAGGVLFVISDLLIFSEMGPLADSVLPALLIWPTYYLGVFLITVGVITTLRKRAPELRVVH
ncbi:lysoplasmalogenase family protein [Erythrobacter sp. EC-HK427]|uniref:lysoplasmalogenase family protein n=1 Tax=Erythrobacter sp. EC-HK427 TaxID=2038396 RepID=UPI001257324F|nr:lysoplasmalogenase family protein [Erythrobacter sp. EC-HK427]VVT16795.1 conserved membrane hypothetical protein [Erythrobacter sp. EC-HK427]